MSCSTFDVKAYFLGDVDRQEKSACESHLAGCAPCREELQRLQLTNAALLSIPDEEIPQRIAFVSDRVFEPRWWQRVWHSGPAMGFASAALLAGAILVHGYTRPAAVNVAAAPVDTAQMERRIDETVNRRVQVAVLKAVGDVEARDAQRSAKLLEAAEKRFDFHRRADLVAAQETIRLYQQQVGRLMYAYNDGAKP